MDVLPHGFIAGRTFPVPVRDIPEIWEKRFGSGLTKRYIATFAVGFIILFASRLAGGCTLGLFISGSTQLAVSGLTSAPADSDLQRLKKALLRIASINGPKEIRRLQSMVKYLQTGQISQAVSIAGDSAIAVHYRIWAKKAENLASYVEFFKL